MQLELTGLTAGLRVVTSAGIEPLFDRLAATLLDEPLPPLEPECIVVAENRGLAGWLELRLADHLGCAAGLDMLSPRGLADRLLRQHLPHLRPQGDSARDPFDRDTLTWRIEALLHEWPEDDRRMLPLRTYIERSGTGRAVLAERLARLFDDYQIYRPDVLEAWGGGADPTPGWQPAAWQAALWRRLRSDSGGRSRVDRSEQLRSLTSWLGERSDPPDHFPARLAVFGALVMPPSHVDLIRAVARLVPVTWYAVFPQAAGGEGAGPRSLLGGQEREFEALTIAREGVHRESIAVARPHSASVLARLQDALRSTSDDRSGRSRVTEDDASLRVHSCHGALRELEVLRDQILDAFETIEGLRPSDVAIFLADPARYAPLVDAVFGEDGDVPAIPFQLIGPARQGSDPLSEAFGRLLELVNGRATASEVLDLLDEPAVRRRAGIDEAELATVRDWVRRAHIRWGVDGRHKEAFGLPADDLHTWRHGLDRLMMGYAMGDEDSPVLDILPLGDPLLDQAELLGRFARWVDSLLDALGELQRARPLARWASDLADVLGRFFEPDGEAEIESIRYLHERIEALLQAAALVPDRGPIPYVEVQGVLAQHLAGGATSYSAPAGRVAVSDFEHLRYVPFRVIAAVGMNDGTFPRTADLPNYDLRTRESRPGDYDPRALDRQLFLDALMAAGDRLIVTFTGRSQKDNSERAPSVVLDALLEVCRQTFTTGIDEPAADARAVASGLVVEHALQPFSPRYFDGEDSRLFSYDARQCLQPVTRREPPVPFADVPLPSEPSGLEEISLRDLADAWSNPSLYFCRALGISFSLEDATLDDAEPIRLDGLQAYSVRDALLGLVLSGVPDDEARSRLERAGTLPAGALGEGWFRRLRREVDRMAVRVRRYGELAPMDCEVVGAGWRVGGRIAHAGDRDVLFFRCASIKSGDQVRAWVTHVALNAARPRRDMVVLGTDHAYRFSPPPDPEGLLEDLVAGFREIRSRPVPLFPMSSEAYAAGRSWQAARAVFRDAYNSRADMDDLHARLCFRHDDPPAREDAEFDRWAGVLWGPLLDHREKEE